MTWLRVQPGPVPLPEPSETARRYWEGLAAGVLLFQRCVRCRAAVHTPAVVCSACGSAALEWEPSAGRGTVYSWTIVWRPQTPAFVVPYAPIVVDMDEGWQLLSALINCDHESVHIGQRVRVVLHEVSGAGPLPYFEPDQPGPGQEQVVFKP